MLDRTTLAPAAGTSRGAYVLVDAGEGLPEIILIATGSEVSLALDAHRQLVGEGIRSRVVSIPSWELFEAQPLDYRKAVLPPAVHARVSVEAASFGASAPGPEVMARYGFSVEHVVAKARSVLPVTRPGQREEW